MHVFNRWKTQYTRASRVIDTTTDTVNNTAIIRKYERVQTPKAKLRREDERKHYQENFAPKEHDRILPHKTDDLVNRATVVSTANVNTYHDDDDDNDHRLSRTGPRTKKKLFHRPHHDDSDNERKGRMLSCRLNQLRL